MLLVHIEQVDLDMFVIYFRQLLITEMGGADLPRKIPGFGHAVVHLPVGGKTTSFWLLSRISLVIGYYLAFPWCLVVYTS